jgi:hypothetical protein
MYRKTGGKIRNAVLAISGSSCKTLASLQNAVAQMANPFRFRASKSMPCNKSGLRSHVPFACINKDATGAKEEPRNQAVDSELERRVYVNSVCSADVLAGHQRQIFHRAAF